jgi:hypothetical protein
MPLRGHPLRGAAVGAALTAALAALGPDWPGWGCAAFMTGLFTYSSLWLWVRTAAKDSTSPALRRLETIRSYLANEPASFE